MTRFALVDIIEAPWAASIRGLAVARGVVGNERTVVILSDHVGDVGQGARRTVFARSTSLVG
jgi:hypothetical protein